MSSNSTTKTQPVRVGTWTAFNRTPLYPRKFYSVNDVQVNALPGGFDPLEFNSTTHFEVLEQVSEHSGDGDAVIVELRGELFRNSDGSYRYDIQHAETEVSFIGEWTGDEKSVSVAAPSPSWSLSEKLIASYEWGKDGKVH